MNEDKRKTRIKSVAEARPKKAPRSYATYWMTRESDGGVLSDRVQVWTARPNREVDETGGRRRVLWMAFKADGEGALYCSWSLAEAHKWARVAPDTDRECVRVGDEDAAS